MTECNIRFAQYDDIESIMVFIDTYWKKGHILAIDRELFEWQYIHYNKVTMVLGEDVDGNIRGILGYIPYDDSENRDIALALWKAQHSESFLGIRLLMFLKSEEPHAHIVCPGINMKTTSKIYSAMGMTVGTMKQWYRLNQREKYFIGLIANKEIPKVPQNRGYSLEKVNLGNNRIEEFNFDVDYAIPHKSKEYFIKRYLQHPRYTYLVYSVVDTEDVAIAWVVLRIQEYDDARVMRFVDFIGNPDVLPNITELIDKEMEVSGAEYVDMYETGLTDEILRKAGWMDVKKSGNVIPNYFAPFEQSNIEIHFCSSDSNAVLFRGDGDQDRPN